MTSGKLSIVATPIGNLEDLTFRALRTLTECDAVYAEDTRVIGKLLARYELKKSLQRLDAATEGKKAEEVLDRLQTGEHIVYVSDAGTPGISDPGARMVAFVRTHAPEVTIEAIPGASALTTALSIAGIDTSSFTFLGFLPHKKGRQTALKGISESEIPVVLYESPHRIEKLLTELAGFEVSRVTIARELTKLHEELVAGTVADVQAHFVAHPDAVRGEFVVLIEP